MSDSDNAKIGYYNPNNYNNVGIGTQVSLKVVAKNSEGEVQSTEALTSVEVTDDKKSIITISRAELNSAIEALGIDESLELTVIFTAGDCSVEIPVSN